MKKFFSLFAALLFAGSMMAAEVTVDYANAGYANQHSLDGVPVQSGVVTITFAKGTGSSAPAYYTTGTGARTYASNTITVDAGASTITKIAFDFSQNNKNYTVDAGTYSKDAKEWTGSANKVLFTTEAGSGHNRIKSITVTYEVGAEVAATGISLDQTALTLTEGETATLKATLTPEGATTTVTWTSSDETVATVASGKVTAVAAGTATITAKAGDYSATCNVTVNAAPVLTCAQANALANGANAKLGEFTVAYANGANTYIKDASGYALIYKYDFGLKAGDVVTGFKGSMNIYNGLPELVPSVTLTDLTVTAGEAPAPEEFIAAPVAADVNKYIILKGVKMTAASFTNKNLTATIGDVNFTLRDNFSTSQTFDTEKTYDVVGAVAIYNGNVQVYFISATEQEEPVDPDQPSVTATPEELEITAEGFEDNTVTLEYANLGETFVVEATADAEATWITNIALNDDKSELTFDVAANDGAARTATITVTATAGETVATATITVSQAAYVAPLTGDYFAKVTATADITDGAYLIVYEGNDSHEAVAFDGSLETLDAVNNGLAVTIAENKIAATDALLAAVFTLDKTAGTLKSASGLYIGKTANANGLDAKADTEYTNTFAIDEDGNAVITASGNCTLRYNYASDQLRFRYYKSGQQAVALYKLVKEQSPATAISNTAVETKAVKTLRNGILVIEKAGVRYNAMGQIIR